MSIMKIKRIAAQMLTILSLATVTATAASYEELAADVPTTRDFTFGLPTSYINVTPLDSDDTGFGTWQRFLDMRQKYPKEIPIFKPYDISGSVEIFVAPNGNDSDPGTKEKPVKTLEKAIAIAGRKQNRDNGIVIYMRAGEYNAADGITIPKYLSGGKDKPVFISAYEDEEVNIVGGISVKGEDFKIADDERAKRCIPKKLQGNIYSINLFEAGYNELPQITTKGEPVVLTDGVKYHMARWPDNSRVKMFKYEGEGAVKGVLDIGPVENTLSGNKLAPDNGQGFEFVAQDANPLEWDNDDNIWMYGAFCTEYAESYKHIRSFNKLSDGHMSVRTYTPESYGCSYGDDLTFYYINVLNELDSPGEWYMDYNTGILYIYPFSDLKDSTVEIVTTDNNLITFEKNTHNVVLNGLNIKNGSGSGVVVNGYNNVIQNCTFSNFIGNAVSILEAYQSGVTCCTMKNTKGVSMSSLNKEAVSLAASLAPSFNFVQNCYVIDGGAIYFSQGGGSIASHNTVVNTNSAFGVNQSYGNFVEYNEAAGVPVSTADTGVIYINGSADALGNHVRYNFFHDSNKARSDPFGIYFDDMSSGNLAYCNILKDCNIFWHGGSDHVAYNNIVMNSPTNAIRDSANYSKGNQLNGIFVSQYLRVGGYRTNFENESIFKGNSIAWASQYPAMTAWLSELPEFRYRVGEEQGLKWWDYSKTEKDQNFLAVKRNVYKNNVIYASNPIQSDCGGEVKQFVETNAEYKKDDLYTLQDGTKIPVKDAIFQDFDNNNFNLRQDSIVYSDIPSFEELPDTQKIGVIVRDDLMKKRFCISDVHLSRPTKNIRTFMEDVEFTWTAPAGGAYYILEIARDSEFNDIIFSKSVITNSYTPDIVFEPDTEYYWRVTVKCYAQSFEQASVTAESSFKTYTYEEACEATVLDFSLYDEAVSKWNEDLKNIIENDGTDRGFGVYNTGTLAKLNNELQSSRMLADKCRLQSELNNEVKRLNKAMRQIKTDEAIPYVRKYKTIEQSDWDINNATMEFKDNTWIASTQGSDWIRDTRIISPNETISVDINLGDMAEWGPIALKQTNKEATWAKSGYYLVYKRDLLEIQKHGEQTIGIVDVVENDSKILTPNTWHNFEYSFNYTDEYVNIKIKIDGKDVFDYYDREDDRMYDDGFFGFETRTTISPEFKLRASE